MPKFNPRQLRAIFAKSKQFVEDHPYISYIGIAGGGSTALGIPAIKRFERKIKATKPSKASDNRKVLKAAKELYPRLSNVEINPRNTWNDMRHYEGLKNSPKVNAFYSENPFTGRKRIFTHPKSNSDILAHELGHGGTNRVGSFVNSAARVGLPLGTLAAGFGIPHTKTLRGKAALAAVPISAASYILYDEARASQRAKKILKKADVKYDGVLGPAWNTYASTLVPKIAGVGAFTYGFSRRHGHKLKDILRRGR